MSEMKSLTLNDKKYDGFVDPVARSLAAATAVIKSASGESIALSDASDVNLYGLNIYGRTTQDGTPTLDAPVELVSVGAGGSITVDVVGKDDSRSMTIATPNGLPGIAVESGGNYTDENGQQWIRDAVDLARGVYVRRTNKYIVNGSTTESWKISAIQTVNGATRFDISTAAPHAGRQICLCNAYVGVEYVNIKAETCWCNDEEHNNTLQFRICTALASSVEEIKAYVQSNPVDVVYVLKTPIETPLSAEEIAAYSALHTYRDNTVVSNDASAHMELEYVMDAKKYIDSMITGAILPATVE
jgi:hypothetical protein